MCTNKKIIMVETEKEYVEAIKLMMEKDDDRDWEIRLVKKKMFGGTKVIKFKKK